MSQYNTAPHPVAHNAGWDATDPELAPFLPMINQSGDRNPPAHARAGGKVGSTMALPPNVESVALHAKAEFIGLEICRISPLEFYPCSACAASFSTNHQLERHATTNKHKAYLCTCRKGFTKLSALRRHIQESTQAREHRCPLCDHKCKRLGHVEQHLRLIHKKPKDVIKNLLSTQKSESPQESEQGGVATAVGTAAGSMAPQADQPVVIPGGPWPGLIGFSTTDPADHPGSRPGDLSAFFPLLPSPNAGQVAQIPVFGSQSLTMQAAGPLAYPAFPAGAAAAQPGFFTNPVTDVSGYPAGPLDEHHDFFNLNPASVIVNPGDGFGMPALETGSMEEFYGFDLNTFGIEAIACVDVFTQVPSLLSISLLCFPFDAVPRSDERPSAGFDVHNMFWL